MGKHLVIAGHGKRRNGTFDPGASGYITKGEHRYVKEDLFPAMKKLLPSYHNIVFFDAYNVYDYGNIVTLARRYNADQVTEIHFDAAGSSASGGHVIIHSAYRPDETDLAFRDAIDKMVGVRYSHRGHRGISGRSNLANVNRTKNAGITYRMLELGFGTNRKDADVMTKQVDKYAAALVEVLTGKPVKQGGLTVEQYNELKGIIEEQGKTIARLEKELAKKENTPAEREVSRDHKEAWEWLTELGATTGVRPYEDVRREQLASILKVYDDKRFPTDGNVSESHEKAWEWLINSGATVGNNPRRPINKEQLATILYNLMVDNNG